jgi:hypothetical protein
VAGSCVHGGKPSVSTTWREFLEQLRALPVSKKGGCSTDLALSCNELSVLQIPIMSVNFIQNAYNLKGSIKSKHAILPPSLSTTP